jgi:hypothetical protein
MGVSRVQFTMRRMMIAVAILSLLVSYAERWRRYNRLAAYHLGKSNWKRPKRPVIGPNGRPFLGPVIGPNGRPSFVGAPTQEDLGHLDKADEYAHAASRPWIRIPPEPLSGGPE